jgi:hypothetical protein
MDLTRKKGARLLRVFWTVNNSAAQATCCRLIVSLAHTFLDVITCNGVCGESSAQACARTSGPGEGYLSSVCRLTVQPSALLLARDERARAIEWFPCSRASQFALPSAQCERRMVPHNQGVHCRKIQCIQGANRIKLNSNKSIAQVPSRFLEAMECM